MFPSGAAIWILQPLALPIELSGNNSIKNEILNNFSVSVYLFLKEHTNKAQTCNPTVNPDRSGLALPIELSGNFSESE